MGIRGAFKAKKAWAFKAILLLFFSHMQLGHVFSVPVGGQIVFLMEEGAFQHCIFLRRAQLFASGLAFIGALQHIPNLFARKLRTLAALAYMMLLGTLYQAIAALLLRRASGAAHFLAGQNAVPPANPIPELCQSIHLRICLRIVPWAQRAVIAA